LWDKGGDKGAIVDFRGKTRMALCLTGRSDVAGNSAPAGADLYNLGTFQISSHSTVGVIGP
jgi:hypothetical protein